MFYQFQHYGASENFSKECGENFNFPIHLHHFFELIAVISGKMDVSVDGTVYPLTKGEAVLVFPHQVHSLASKTSRHILCIFSPELIKAYTNRYAAKIPENNAFTLNPYLIEQLKNIREEASSFEKKGFLYSICATLDASTTYRERMNLQENLLYKCFDFVEKNYKNDCSLHALTQDINFSYSYMSRYFKKMTGVSFNEYVNQYRISKACHLLTESGCSVLECAYEVGYTALRSFNRNFKEYTGKTPNQYRK